MDNTSCNLYWDKHHSFYNFVGITTSLSVIYLLRTNISISKHYLWIVLIDYVQSMHRKKDWCSNYYLVDQLQLYCVTIFMQISINQEFSYGTKILYYALYCISNSF